MMVWTGLLCMIGTITEVPHDMQVCLAVMHDFARSEHSKISIA
ncbi:hypothetical protein XYCOK13_10030 [Xylanibacillus composti]|uniref:Uncharacterized protein n=1 Tax=Xylanibacillus composti TaxID=1572762 RepID=A0A8J4M158_9BACL|nr:hypothetical protein XYCOK13_10030 [Xylanibacillus composti]